MEPWLDPVYDAAGMAAADRYAIETAGVPSLDLMEAAGRGLAEVVAELAQPGPVRVVCGKGNNGGDGLVAARHLAGAGFEVEVLLLWPADQASPDSKANLERLAGVQVVEIGDPDAALDGSGAVIDAVFGTGFSGEPRPPAREAIEAMARCGAPLVACDVPSGVDASTGEAATAAPADATVTFHGLKLGHLIAPGKHLCGEVTVVPIGIPADAPGGEAGGVIGRGVLDAPARRGSSSTKFSSGQVVIAGGSRGLTGAVCLAAEAAIRGGAGYATVAVPADLEPIFEVKLTEVMSIGVGEGDFLAQGSAAQIARACGRAAAVVLGSGLGREESSFRLVRELVAEIEAPLVLDADGLGAFNGDAAALASRPGPTVLTPHEGEMGRLLGRDSSEVRRRRLEAARELAELSGAVVVLKGDDSIVTQGSGGEARLAVNAFAAPALATAGTGDVLAGLVGALLARCEDAFTATCAAVLAHARAGRLAAEAVGNPDAVIATDVIAALPAGTLPFPPVE